ncbi:MAG TPA: 30S ribosome-binding factor RbfA [Lachnospiraceae bacterium]|jgi:ribosome-binding factor A|nr:30S ribosome-binding factor RbfA [Lachnospiraceae bacterium]MDD7664943.1 30S ribosome-binding factor RbfA [Lachnospiraceae bacterium]MDY4164359.1 30S ribosome-binding factor RbfA [Lachnospiraceae bacterium]HAP04024.1 30S ribosome-binding factor RbfA [Lachnospiraceae bacterium]
MRKGSTKNNRINEDVARVISVILREDVKDPRISPIVSVTEAIVAPDLKTAKIFISVLGSDEDGERTMEGIKSSAGYIRHQLAERLNLRNTPVLDFILDKSIAYGVDMSHKIDEVMEHDEEIEKERGDK